LTEPEGDPLLDAAQRMLEEPSRGTVSAWPRAVALLARQRLEAALGELWRARLPGAEQLTMRAQLACARSQLGPELAGELAYTWHALSRATHHHHYELDPTREELATLLSAVRRLVGQLRAPTVIAAAGTVPARTVPAG